MTEKDGLLQAKEGELAEAQKEMKQKVSFTSQARRLGGFGWFGQTYPFHWKICLARSLQCCRKMFSSTGALRTVAHSVLGRWCTCALPYHYVQGNIDKLHTTLPCPPKILRGRQPPEPLWFLRHWFIVALTLTMGGIVIRSFNQSRVIT